MTKKEEGVIRSDMEVDKELISIISMYNGEGGKNLIECLEDMTELEGEKIVIVEGNFNLRLGNLGKKGINEKETKKHSKDKCIGNGGTG